MILMAQWCIGVQSSWGSHVMLYNTESLLVDVNGNVFGKCHAPCSQLKTSFEDFEKEHAHYSRYKYINLMFMFQSKRVSSWKCGV